MLRYNFPISKLQRVLLLILCLASYPEAWAQWGGMGGMGGMGGSGGMGSRRGGYDRPARSENNDRATDRAMSNPNSSDQLIYRLNTLQTDLQLNDSQLPLWQSFAEKTRQYIDGLVMEKLRTPAPTSTNLSSSGNSMSGGKWIAQAVDASRQKYTLLEDLELTSKKLEESLSPQQRTTFDLRIPTIVVPQLSR